MEEHREDNTSLKDAVTSDRSIMNSRGQAVQRVVSPSTCTPFYGGNNLQLCHRRWLFLCGARHACLRHRRLNEFILSPSFPSLVREEARAKGDSPLCRNFAIFPLCRVYHELMKELRVKENIFFFLWRGGKKSSPR